MAELQTPARLSLDELVIDGGPLTIDQIQTVATGRRGIRIDGNPELRERMQASVQLVDRAVNECWQVYGVTTGFGGMADVAVPREMSSASQNNLLMFLASGAGRPIDRQHVRAAMALRANVLLRGVSGVRLEVVERLVEFLAADATPVVRELGSIGASGDLVPLATIARAITGQSNFCRIDRGGQMVSAKSVLSELGMSELQLQPKEGLAIVNGTSFSAAIAANCIYESEQLSGLTLANQAMMLRALNVQDDPFHPFVHRYKPHPGQVWTANAMRRLLNEGFTPSNGKPQHVQDRYSLRCLPQYMGPIIEGLVRVRQTVTTEMNAVSDNPLVDSSQQRFYQGGNFLGQYIGMAMDDLRRYLGLMAKHLDVQIAQLVSPEFSRGLSGSLRGNDDLAYNMGLKGLQITGNSIMPMLTYYGNPIVEHFPTHAEQFNQNVNGLSWGSANLAWQSVEMFQHYTAVALLFSIQALDLRANLKFGHYDGRVLLGDLTEPVYSAVYECLDLEPGQQRPFLFDDGDQWLEEQLEQIVSDIRADGRLIDSISDLMDSYPFDGLEN